MTPYARFAAMTDDEAVEALLTCCGSPAWAAGVAGLRKGYTALGALLQASSNLWFGLAEADWLEAFACHPRIGESRPASSDFLAHSTGEQAAARETLAAVAQRLAEGNRAYEAKFGFVYLVFASGRTAPELLQVLQSRLRHTREQELQEAARQQDLITTLRMERWLSQ